MDEQIAKSQNKMGVMPINKLIISMSLPMMASMLVQALYNIVDSIFVAQISENALNAVTLAFPVQNIMISIGVGTGVGINALIAKYLGQREYKKANEVATNGVFLAALSYVVMLVFGICFSAIYYRVQTDNAEIIAHGISYLSIVSCCSFGIFGQLVFEKLLQATGKTFYSMVVQAIGAVINIILDPILIFGWFGLPKMGVAGAAIATVIGQITSFVVAVFINHYKNSEIRVKIKGFKPSGKTIRNIYSVGVPSIIMSTIGSVMIFVMNMILIGFTVTATAVFGIYFKLQSFIMMPVFGLNNCMVPIISYNYGAGNHERMIKTAKLGIAYATAIMVIGVSIMEIFPKQLLMCFNPSENMLAIGIPALRITSLCLLLAGFSIICSSVFQALGKAVWSMIVSFIRQVVVLLPVAFLLSLTNNLNFVWLAFPIAEVFALAVSAILFKKVYKSILTVQ